MDAKTALENATALQRVTTAIGAVGAVGTAAMGLVDTLKTLPGGGISQSGFKFIRRAIEKLTPPVQPFIDTELSQENILRTLKSQWINGTATADQVSIAKSLLKLRLVPETAGAMAEAAGVDAAVLSQVAEKLKDGAPLDQQTTQANVYGRFDLLLTTLLDQAYQRASQRYRNAAKFAAVVIAVVLSAWASHLMDDIVSFSQAVLLGLIATPLAPVAKDLATGLTTAMQALQSWKK
jgi:hypothetical protein